MAGGSFPERLWRLVVGRPRRLEDRTLARGVTLVPILAWVGLGADGMSSCTYGPEECFRALGEHTYLALPLALMIAITVFVISACFTGIIQRFPQGGGAYAVTSSLLGRNVGLVAGSALLTDYVLTISVSVAAAGAAAFSTLPPEWSAWKLPFETVLIGAMIVLNLRGVRESVTVLAPIFGLFLVTHVVAIVGGVVGQVPHAGETARQTAEGFRDGWATMGLAGLLGVFVHAFALGGGTYTGIEAVSNGLPIMREPRVATARRTMAYMASALAFTAAGLLLCFLMWDVTPEPGRTMNATFLTQLTAGLPMGTMFVIVTMLSAGALLVVAAQTGFIGGPRVLSSMALDSWVPHRFAALSERLSSQNGTVLMGLAALAALLYTGGVVHQLVVMYSINVFLTFSLAIFGMLRHAVQTRRSEARWRRQVLLFGVGFALCATILVLTVVQKFGEGGWVTLAVTGSVCAVCLAIRSHYENVRVGMKKLTLQLDRTFTPLPPPGDPDPTQPAAGVLVGDYGGLGLHTMLNIFGVFPGHFRSLVFISVGVVDMGEFKGEFAIARLNVRTEAMLDRYVSFARAQGVPATSRWSVGTDVVEATTELCQQVAQEFPRITFFAGKLIFERETWIQRILHNQTAFAIQRRLHFIGRVMVILPIRVR